MEDIVVSSWNDLNEWLYADSWKPSLGRHRSDYIFRGMSNCDYGLETSLMRLGEGYDKLEGPLLRTFRRYAHRHAASVDTVWNWLSLAQHHGLPTRLLDWSFSPFIGMHFATEHVERFNEHGVIWCVDYVRANQYLPEKLKRLLETEGANVFTVEMLAGTVKSLHEFDTIADSEYVLFLEPPSLDDRIVNQYALFSLMSNPRLNMETWLLSHPDLYRRLIIPAELKWEIRDKLDQANITERMLYPGLDGLSRWLKRYYTPR